MPRRILIFGGIWYILTIGIISFWKQRTFDTQIQIKGLTLPNFETPYHPSGGGISGLDIFSSSFPYFILIFTTINSIIPLLAQYFTNYPKNIKQMRIAQAIWLTGWSSLVIYHLLILYFRSFHWIPELILSFGCGLIFILVFLQPEAMIITHAQIIRTHSIYESIKSQQSIENKPNMLQIQNYLEFLQNERKIVVSKKI